MTESLSDIATKYGTDKGPKGHGYTEAYEELLGHLKGREIRILEIGVAEGRSLQMWREFFPMAFIVGMDNSSDTNTLHANIFLRGDQRIPSDLRRAAELGPYNFIVDDAGHTEAGQVCSFFALFPLYVCQGGYYFIEDLAGTDTDRVISSLTEPCRQYMRIESIESRSQLLVIKKAQIQL